MEFIELVLLSYFEVFEFGRYISYYPSRDDTFQKVKQDDDIGGDNA